MSIYIRIGDGEFRVVVSQGGYEVVARNRDDVPVAALASRHATAMTAMHYTPDMGEQYAFFAKTAARYLAKDISSDIPHGNGELEQALPVSPVNRFSSN